MAQPNVGEIVRAIAKDTHASLETVTKLYSDIWAQFEQEARIADDIPLFVAKRVRAHLKNGLAWRSTTLSYAAIIGCQARTVEVQS